METSDLRIGDVLKNTRSGFIGKLAAVHGVRLTLLDQSGAECLFHFGAFWEMASPEQASDFLSRMKTPSKAALRAVKRGRSSDPAEVERQFEAYMLQLQRVDPKIEESFRKFWTQVLEIIGSQPGKTWEMRHSQVFGLNVVIKIPSKRSNSTNWVHFIHLFGDGGAMGRSLEIIALDEFVPEKFEFLFPQRQSFYGTGSGAVLEYEDLGLKQTQYLEFIAASLRLEAAANGPGPVKE